MGLRTQVSAFIKPDSWEIDKYFQGPGRCQKAHFHPFFEREKGAFRGPSNRQLVPDTFRKRNPESDAMGERGSRRPLLRVVHLLCSVGGRWVCGRKSRA